MLGCRVADPDCSSKFPIVSVASRFWRKRRLDAVVSWLAALTATRLRCNLQLGCSQVVRHRILIPVFPGSNPGTPANYQMIKSE